MALRDDMKVYYETFPESLYYCDFCSRSFRTLIGLRNHAVRKHAAEMDANRQTLLSNPKDALDAVATDYPEE
jgi:hypothetical protein